MKKRILGLLIMFCVFSATMLRAQEYLPFVVSPYAGVTAGQVNPASLAGTKYKWDITVFGGSGGVHNDFMLLSRKKQIFNINFYQDMLSHRKDFRKGNVPPAARDDIKHYLNRTASLYDQDVYGGTFWGQMDIAHIMYSVSDRFSIAAGYSQKALMQASDVPHEIATAAFGSDLPGFDKGIPGFNTNTGINQNKSVGSASTFLSVYNQISLTGAYTFIDNEIHKLKGGLTAKFIFGGKSGFVYADGMNLDYSNGTADRVSSISGGEAGKSTKSKLGLGGDIGLEYEFQPASLKGNEVAEYRLKAGISLVDIGGYKATNTDHLQLQGGSGVPSGFNDLLARYGIGQQLGDYRMSLPTLFSAQVDYNFGNGIFLNFSPYIAMNQTSAHKMAKYTSFNLVPHFEKKNFGASLPLQYDQYGKFTAGLGLRAWRHVWVGSNTILKNLWPGDNKNFSADLHVMVKIPILKDVNNNDRDGDGVPDKDDKCPDSPGPKKFDGCPDTDGDGILDHEDKCPNDAGPASTQGCPDRDGDGVIDSQDRCPDVAGPVELQGCPDRDGDGVPDIDDKCPDVPGTKATKGCPDRDGDGVADADDRCPDVAGPVALQGCPDRDGDGVADIDDKCPDVAGTKANNGCPDAVSPKTVIEFQVDKFNIESRYNSALDAVVKKLSENGDATVHIVGHTDNTHTRAYNMALSKRRAEAVKRYLTGKKVAAKRITTEYFGPDKPIADNNTAEGRQKNRRAEITIVVKQ